jgi:hypothetical protein
MSALFSSIMPMIRENGVPAPLVGDLACDLAILSMPRPFAGPTNDEAAALPAQFGISGAHRGLLWMHAQEV